ncbi:hypothetical protein EVAR_80831_1 [Eumeta japonica]|uniref:Uncharacterized protein n=1 Tax=Eumeta variegata TaxID=151549 RepID=A0A4C1WDN4_EUMVA|nr:hypothetical protein EVAR_80831_1 [Eumeta japonica]
MLGERQPLFIPEEQGHAFVSICYEPHSTNVVFGPYHRRTPLTQIFSPISAFELVKPVAGDGLSSQSMPIEVIRNVTECRSFQNCAVPNLNLRMKCALVKYQPLCWDGGTSSERNDNRIHRQGFRFKDAPTPSRARGQGQSSLELGDARSGRTPEAAIDADLGATAGESIRASC